MRTRPKNLTALAGFLLLAAALIPVQIMVLYGHGPTEMNAVAAKIAPLNWAVLAMAAITAWLCLRASRGLFIAVPLLGLVVGYNNWLVSSWGTDYSPQIAWAGTLAFTAILATSFSPRTLAVIWHPNRRWWLTPARHRVAVPVKLKMIERERMEVAAAAMDLAGSGSTLSPAAAGESLAEFDSETYDISSGGMFVPFDAKNPFSGLRTIRVGSQFWVQLPLKGREPISCRAQVVRTAEPSGQYPGGLGIRFLEMDWQDHQTLTGFLENRA